MSLASAVPEMLKGKPQISGSSPSPGPHPLFIPDGRTDGQTDGRTDGFAVGITALCIASNAAAL